MDTATTILLENASRLLQDARSLRKLQSYPSATALAILSLEEVGKLLLIRNFFREPLYPTRQELRGHKKKQRAAAKAMIGSMGIDESEALLGAKGFRTVLRKILKSAAKKKGQEDVDIISQITDAEFEQIVAPNIRNSRQNKFVVWAARGDFDEIKQRAFYVDLEANGTIYSMPSEIDRDTFAPSKI